ncbi:FAD-linked oxidoreductase [Basidiobolus meristosporus CBS 931.73]|uniref:Proline dehydrogenase n=1 Tax=Basidiobolus meristosporus CBS 931.73 TaxID=1314790 RepID=A0A1Y1YF85_9FUNG|nr:FAD-linked oxidoreductase [Basidiobolus meristosporus CBS 931.73]|eukprot:ORX96672.1 FAD-linked oxidoreductase [Basidiobolus meristosporus CBS 931.73]
MCMMTTLVELSPQLIKLCETLHLTGPAYWFIKNTFFNHFCGGETPEEISVTMEGLKSAGIGSILDVSIEVDLDELHEEDTPEAIRALWNGRADHVASLLKGSVKAASVEPNSFAAIKLTPLLSPLTLQKVSYNLYNLRASFETSPQNSAAYVPLNQSELEDFDLFMERINGICEYAKQMKVRLMIDAEQSYFQDAIDYAALEVSRRYNQLGQEMGPLVFNTYQMYLKDSTRKLRSDYERSQRQNFTFGAKLVRGAYMVTERKRCAKLGISDIINDTIEDTHHCYDSGVEFLLDQINPTDTLSTTHAAFMVASHNKDSVNKTCIGLEKRGFAPKTEMVMFGQLMGMKDNLSYSLGGNGYRTFKYVPYGPIQEVVPYLIRRAQENSTVLGAAQEEYDLIASELKLRLLGQAATIPIEVKTA